MPMPLSREFKLVRHPERERGGLSYFGDAFRSCEVLRCAQDDMAFCFCHATSHFSFASDQTAAVFGLRHSFVIRPSCFVIPPCLCKAVSTSASRSAVRPARNFACRSGFCALNQVSESRAVSASGRNVRPFANARLIFVR